MFTSSKKRGSRVGEVTAKNCTKKRDTHAETMKSCYFAVLATFAVVVA